MSKWNARSKECPNCRAHVREVNKNHFLNNLIEIYLKSHTNEKRTEDEIRQLEAVNVFTSDRINLKKKEEISSEDSASSSSDYEEDSASSSSDHEEDSASSSSDYEEEVPPVPRRRQVNTVTAVNIPNCRQCTRQIDGFRCPVNQQHIPCKRCNNFMPVRVNLPQKCAVCDAGFCNLYWRTGRKCATGVISNQITALNNHIATTFATIPANLLNDNKFEQNVLTDYIQGKRISLDRVAREILQDHQNGVFDILISRL